MVKHRITVIFYKFMNKYTYNKSKDKKILIGNSHIKILGRIPLRQVP